MLIWNITIKLYFSLIIQLIVHEHEYLCMYIKYIKLSIYEGYCI